MIAKKAVNSFVRTPYETIKDELFLKELVDSLAMSGIANEIAQVADRILVIEDGQVVDFR